MNFQCQREKPPSLVGFWRFFRLCDFDAKEKLTRRSCRCFRHFFWQMLGAGRFQDQVLLGARTSSAFPALGTHQEPFFLSGECDRNRRLTLAWLYWNLGMVISVHFESFWWEAFLNTFRLDRCSLPFFYRSFLDAHIKHIGDVQEEAA